MCKEQDASICVHVLGGGGGGGGGGGRVGGETNSCEHIVATEMKISKSTLPPQCCEVGD